MSAKKLQEDYDLALDGFKRAEEHLQGVLSRAKKEGFYFSNDKIIENNDNIVVFYDLTYYSHYDGHTNSPIYRDYIGSFELENTIVTNFMIIYLNEFIGKNLLDRKRDIELLEVFEGEVLDKMECIVSESIEDYPWLWEVSTEDDGIKVTYENERSEIEEICNGSYFLIKKCKVDDLWDDEKNERRG